MRLNLNGQFKLTSTPRFWTGSPCPKGGSQDLFPVFKVPAPGSTSRSMNHARVMFWVAFPAARLASSSSRGSGGGSNN